jgi:hypothetical protein
MKAINELKTLGVSRDINFDALCQEFDGRSFYGLEYVLDDFFQNTIAKPPVAVSPGVDWFGLYS